LIIVTVIDFCISCILTTFNKDDDDDDDDDEFNVPFDIYTIHYRLFAL